MNTGWLARLRKRTSSPPTAPARQTWSYTGHVWSIGIYLGDSPCSLKPSEEIQNPVLSAADVCDVAAVFVADPFMIKVQEVWHMFFEVMGKTGKGQIGWATSLNARHWEYQRIVLAEPFHLSYPYVFEWQSEYYMIPESHQTRSVRLYRAARFPEEWIFVKTLVSGLPFSDSSIFRYEQRWWLFTETGSDYRCDTLRLFYADELWGPWLEHPSSPIVEGNPHTARPAGRVLALPDRIIRYAQDCFPVYGTQVRAYEITTLNPATYQERGLGPLPVLTGSGVGWNACGMHHVDPHCWEGGGWIACVDGWDGR